MPKSILVFIASVCLLGGKAIVAQTADTLTSQVKKYVSVSTPKIVLTHVEIIDGTGGTPIVDQNLVIERGKITAISAGSDAPQSEGTTVLNLRGYSVMPGIVGMHGHLYYFAFPNLSPDFNSDDPVVKKEMVFSGPRMYLANGVTTMRTAGTY